MVETAGDIIRRSREIAKKTGKSELDVIRSETLKSIGQDVVKRSRSSSSSSAGDIVKEARDISRETGLTQQEAAQILSSAPPKSNIVRKNYYQTQNVMGMSIDPNIQQSSTIERQYSKSQLKASQLTGLPPSNFDRDLSVSQLSRIEQKSKVARASGLSYQNFTTLGVGGKLKAGIKAVPSLLSGAIKDAPKDIKEDLSKFSQDKTRVFAATTVLAPQLNFLGTVAKGLLLTEASTRAGIKVSELTAPQEQKEFIQDRDTFLAAQRSGQEAITQNILSKGQNLIITQDDSLLQKAGKKVKQIGLTAPSDLPIVPLFLDSDKQSFKQGVTKFYQERGLSGDKLKAAVSSAERQRKAGLISEPIGIFGANVFSEIAGQGFVSTAFKSSAKTIAKEKAASEVFKKTAIQIGKAGIIEGAASERASQIGRFQDFNLKKLGIAAGVGGVSAGLIGGTIASRSLKGKGGLLKTAAYISDPFEFPADKTADLLTKGSSKITQLPVITPAITKDAFGGVTLGVKEDFPKPMRKEQPKVMSLPQGANIFSTSSQSQSYGSKTPNKPDIFPKVPDLTSSMVKVDKTPPVPPIVNRGGRSSVFTIPTIPTMPQVPVLPRSPVNIPTIVRQNVPTMPQVPVLPRNNIFTTPQVPVMPNVPAFVTTPVSTLVVNPMIPPPLPIDLSLGSGFGRGGSRGGRKFINELAVGSRVLSDLGIGTGFKPIIPTASKPKKKPKRKSISKPRSKKRALSPFDELLRGFRL